MSEDRDWQRLDKWLWCARFMKSRADCARFVAETGLRLNRQLTDKPHARLRPGDRLTLIWRGQARVIQVIALAARRGPATEAQGLYAEIAAPACANDETPPLPAAETMSDDILSDRTGSPR